MENNRAVKTWLIVLSVCVVAAVVGVAVLARAVPEARAIRERIAIDARDDSYLHSGADLYVYSDDHATQKLHIDGGTGDLDTEGDIDTATGDIEVGGVQIIDMAEFGASTVTTDTTTNLLELLDTTPVLSAGTNSMAALNIDLGIGNSTGGTNSVYGILIDSISQDAENTEDAIAVGSGWDYAADFDAGVTIDGGMLNVGTGTCGVADGDNDVCIAAVLEVDGEAEFDGAIDADSTSDFADTATFSKGSGTALDVSSGGELNIDGTLDANSTSNFQGAVTLQGALYTSFTDLAVSDGDTITPTYTTYALDTSGAVTITLNATGQEGQLLVIINDDANATIIADTNLRSSDGNAITLAGAYDVAVFVYQDSEWLELLSIADS